RACCGGGRMRRSTSVLRFCTMAARWNSSRAPDKGTRGRCLNIDDHSILNVNQIVEAVAELTRLLAFAAQAAAGSDGEIPFGALRSGGWGSARTSGSPPSAPPPAGPLS